MDDIALLENDIDRAQAMLCNIAVIADLIGLKISKDKTKILTNSKDILIRGISIDNSRLDVVDQLKYLGSIIDISGGCSTEFQSRISSALIVFAQLKKNLWRQRDVLLKTRAKSSSGTCDKVGRAKSSYGMFISIFQDFPLQLLPMSPDLVRI